MVLVGNWLSDIDIFEMGHTSFRAMNEHKCPNAPLARPAEPPSSLPPAQHTETTAISTGSTTIGPIVFSPTFSQEQKQENRQIGVVAQPKREEPSPNLQFGDVVTRPICLIGDIWSFDKEVKEEYFRAILLEVRNCPKEHEDVGVARIKGELTFHSPTGTQHRGSPCAWIDEYLNFVQIGAGESGWIVAAILYVHDDWRTVTHRRGKNYLGGQFPSTMDMVTLPITDSPQILEVSINSEKGGRKLITGKYLWKWALEVGHLDIKRHE
jgi:hypothetical protein